jgi:hypothetical protein
METDKRLTVDQVKAAYAKIAAAPCRGSMVAGARGIDLACCGLGAFALANDVEPIHDDDEGEYDEGPIWNFVSDQLGPHYVSGFYNGFDDVGGVRLAWHDNEPQRWKDGYADGQRAAAAVFTKKGDDDAANR